MFGSLSSVEMSPEKSKFKKGGLRRKTIKGYTVAQSQLESEVDDKDKTNLRIWRRLSKPRRETIASKKSETLVK